MYNSTDHPPLDDPNVFILYRYHPSLAAAIIFIVCFSFTTAFHIFQLFRYRTWFFIPLIVGGLFELVGYIGRVLSSRNQWLLSPYIMQTLLILVAPALFAATIYMTLGRIILLLQGEKHAVIRPKWLTKIFVSGDVLCFLVQAGGAGILATKSKNAVKLGQDIIIVGLCIQIVSFGFFVISTTIFHRRTKSFSIPAAAPQDWKKYLFVLYAASTLILIRSVFRVIEYAVGNDGYILRHEVFLYVFDACLMFGVLTLFNFVHPGKILSKRTRSKHRTFAEEDGTSTELFAGPGSHRGSEQTPHTGKYPNQSGNAR